MGKSHEVEFKALLGIITAGTQRPAACFRLVGGALKEFHRRGVGNKAEVVACQIGVFKTAVDDQIAVGGVGREVAGADKLVDAELLDPGKPEGERVLCRTFGDLEVKKDLMLA